MKKRDSYKVPVQNGPINPNPMTMKQMLYPEKVKERAHQMSELRRCQTLDLQTPRQGR